MNPNDFIECALSTKAEGEGALSIEGARPTLDNASDCIVRFAPDEPEHFVTRNSSQRCELLANGRGHAGQG